MGCLEFIHGGHELANATMLPGFFIGARRGNLALPPGEGRGIKTHGCHEFKKLGLGALGQTARLLQFGSKLLNVLFNHDEK